MDSLKLLHGFVKVVLCISRPLLNKTKPRFKAFWSFEQKVLNMSEYSMPWVRCAFDQSIDNVFYYSSQQVVEQGNVGSEDSGVSSLNNSTAGSRTSGRPGRPQYRT